jgi:eukaryotic-like serine/threonine-protein kinase
MDAGQVLSGRYRLDSPIATGGMGEVWRATDRVLDRPVAVKVLRADLSSDATFGARFRAEARTLATVHDPGVVAVYDYGEYAERGATELAYLVMAYVDGFPLSRRIAEDGRLTPDETMTIVAQVADALEAAHSVGIVHRDVKPDNVLIGSSGHAVLVDFGIAHTLATEGLTGVRDVVGTALYMAPEQAIKSPVTPATDVYALGALAYHCLAGQPPFVGDNALSVAMAHVQADVPPLPADVPPAVRDVVMTAMAKDPGLRFPTAAAMAAAARSAGSGSATAVIGGVGSAGTTARFAPAAVPVSPVPYSPRPYSAPDAYAQPTTFAPVQRRRHTGRIAAVVLALAGVGAAVAALLAMTSPNAGGNSPSVGTSVSTTNAPTGHGQSTSGKGGSSRGSANSSGSSGHSVPPGATPGPTRAPTSGTPTTAPSTGSSTGGGGSSPPATSGFSTPSAGSSTAGGAGGGATSDPSSDPSSGTGTGSGNGGAPAGGTPTSPPSGQT